MGNLAPVLLAFILNCVGIHIFTTPHIYESLAYLTYLIFLTSVFFLLWTISLRPTNFRKLFIWADFVFEFLIAMISMEFIANNFLFPLEIAFIASLSQIPVFVRELMETFGHECIHICEFLECLQRYGTLALFSYLLSIFFFLCIIHATKVVDFGLLRKWGLKAFLADTVMQGRIFYEKVIAMINRKRKPEQNVLCAPKVEEVKLPTSCDKSSHATSSKHRSLGKKRCQKGF